MQRFFLYRKTFYPSKFADHVERIPFNLHVLYNTDMSKLHNFNNTFFLDKLLNSFSSGSNSSSLAFAAPVAGNAERVTMQLCHYITGLLAKSKNE